MMLAIDMEELARLKVSCDGVYPGTRFVCFTDRDPESPAFGASFDLERGRGCDLVAGHIPIRDVLCALKKKRAEFFNSRNNQTEKVSVL